MSKLISIESYDRGLKGVVALYLESRANHGYQAYYEGDSIVGGGISRRLFVLDL